MFGTQTAGPGQLLLNRAAAEAGPGLPGAEGGRWRLTEGNGWGTHTSTCAADFCLSWGRSESRC